MWEDNVRKFHHGDKKSFQLLFNKLYSIMCLFAMKFLHDYDDSEDMVQEVFITLWNQREKFDSNEQIKAFLYLSVRNKCLNFLDHQVVKQKFIAASLINKEELTEELVLEAEVIQNINIAINKLSGQRKQIIILTMQGLKNGEIALKMNISINTVKLQKKIAYRQLREKLEPSLFIYFILF
jgi:RNA polymerase sigma-70 factor (ECF subfamily)